MAWRTVDFKVGQWPNQVDDLQGLSNNIELLRSRYIGEPILDVDVVRGLIRIDTSSTTWSVELNKGASWIQLYKINTVSGMVEYPGAFVSGDSLQDGSINTTHIVDGSLPARVVAPLALKEHHVSSGAITRSHVASGAIRQQDLQDRAITKGKVGPDAIDGARLSFRSWPERQSTSTSLEVRDFWFGFPDVRGAGAILHARTGYCGFEGSSDGKTGFRLQSSSTTSMQVHGYVQHSS